LADTSLPTAHWAGRLTILFILAVLIFAAAFTGAVASSFTWTVHCGTHVAKVIWEPLTETDEPAGGC
jgi:hypothetical protein